MDIKGRELVCEPATKYTLSKKLGCWVRTWFTIEKEDNGYFFKQNNAFSNDRNTAWNSWSIKPRKK